MPERVTICNTSPLLYLYMVGQLELLPQLYGQVLIPPAVQAELEAGDQRGVSVPAVETLSWLQVTPLASLALLPLVTDLGRGEAEVIGLGLERPNCRLILDDELARRIARLNGLRFTGTMGVILRAKQRGLLDAVKPVVLALRLFGISQGKATYGGTRIRRIDDNPQGQGIGVGIELRPEGCHNSAA